jgi:prepilin-type N-terminal cleavage/methylation domain-containing protein
MGYLKQALKAQKGFTLVEMTVVIAIIAVLAALSLPAVTGLTTTSRGTSKIGDLKEVEQAMTRYESDNPGDFTGSTPTVDVTDADQNGTITILVPITGVVTTGTTPTTDVTCAGTNTPDAIATCFGNIVFTSVIPDYLKSYPQHYADNITAGNNTGTGVGDDDITSADFTIPECDLAGNTCEFYLGNNEDLLAALDVWTVGTDNQVFIFKENAVYGQ